MHYREKHESERKMNNNNNFDYHLHTYYSDGSLSPTDIVKRAKDMELVEIAITDHDGIDGVKEAQIAGKDLDISVISGIELDTNFVYGGDDEAKDLTLHILGYRIDIKNKALLAKLEVMKEARADRNARLLTVLENMGYPVDESDLYINEEQEYVGKPTIARALVKKGYISSPKEAFEEGKFLEAEEAKAVKKSKISSEEGIDLIKQAKGTAVLAHPMKIKKIGERGSEEFYGNLDKILRSLKIAGLGGVECFHSSHTREEALRLVEYAEKYHLHVTTGSDYHGPDFE